MLGGGIVKLILYEFIKIPQSFFYFKKTTAPFTREPLTDSARAVANDTVQTTTW